MISLPDKVRIKELNVWGRVVEIRHYIRGTEFLIKFFMNSELKESRLDVEDLEEEKENEKVL